MSLDKIAKHAGVSIATVSRVLNRSPSVRPRTADLVWKTIRELKYTMPAGNSTEDVTDPVSGRTGNVAMVFLGGGSVARLKPVFLRLISGIEQQLRDLGLRMMFREVADVTDLDRQVSRREVDGAIVLAQADRSSTDDIRRLADAVPTVRVMGMQAGTPVVDHVVPHNWALGQMAFDYLRSRGCRRVTYMYLPVFTPHLAGVHRMRAASFAMAARSAGVDVDFYWVGEDRAAAKFLAVTPRTAATPAALADAFVAGLSHGTGVFLSTDQEVARLYPLLLARGVQPGRDVVPVSCDNEVPTLEPLNPRPATIDIQTQEIGRQAVLRLLRRIRHPGEPPLLIEVSPRLVVPDEYRPSVSRLPAG